ncbi:unnamed protein product [Ranitomeya imitator]|uniref:F5/8 type C domain-containing protein n=1 Tax=Ranitomeya imitator TaxID=111125 RepID=A0ABN9LMV6_9NEOB|nr:unnamed protein product [Ranitomeya imitator]
MFDSGDDNCDDPLVSPPLPQTAFDSSSGSLPSNAKLNSRDGVGGWSPLESNVKQWLQIDLGGRFDITGLASFSGCAELHRER